MLVPLAEAGILLVFGRVRFTVDSAGVRTSNPSCRGQACCCGGCRCWCWLFGFNSFARGRGWRHGCRAFSDRVRLRCGRRCHGGLMLHTELGDGIDNGLQLLLPGTSSLQLHKQVSQNLGLASDILCSCHGRRRRCCWSHCSRWTARLRCFGRRCCLSWGHKCRRGSWTGRVRWPLEKHCRRRGHKLCWINGTGRLRCFGGRRCGRWGHSKCWSFPDFRISGFSR